MKRIVTLTAAALMMAGTTSLSLAGEHMAHDKQTPSAVQSQPAVSTAPAESKPAVSMGEAKESTVENGKGEVQPSKQPAAKQKMAQESTSVTEKKEVSTTKTMASEEEDTAEETEETSTDTNPTE